MPRSINSLRVLKNLGRERAKLPAHLMKKVSANSPQLVLPTIGQTIIVEDKKENKFKMVVTQRPGWVPKETSGYYQVKVKWLETEYTACWNKITRKWTLNNSVAEIFSSRK